MKVKLEVDQSSTGFNSRKIIIGNAWYWLSWSLTLVNAKLSAKVLSNIKEYPSKRLQAAKLVGLIFLSAAALEPFGLRSRILRDRRITLCTGDLLIPTVILIWHLRINGGTPGMDIICSWPFLSTGPHHDSSICSVSIHGLTCWRTQSSHGQC